MAGNGEYLRGNTNLLLYDGRGCYLHGSGDIQQRDVNHAGSL